MVWELPSLPGPVCFMKILSLLFLFLCLPLGAQTTSSFIPLQSGWRYLDNGTDQGTAWRSPGFDDAAWSQGGAELGYGDGDEVTTVGFGPSSTAKYITTYFRKSFTVTGAASYTAAQLRVRRDDGVVVYLNGTEVFRSNMPAGTVTSATLATAAVSGADEATLFSSSVNPLLLVEGANVIAAEIHQNVGTSSDLSFDLEFTATIPGVIPAANAQTVSVTEDTPKALTLTGTDPNGDPLSYAVVTPPVKGVLSGTPPALTYTPELNANGVDSFTFTVSDGVNISPPATVTLNIAAVNDAPVADAGAQSVTEDGAVTFNVSGSDVESTFGMLGDYVQQLYNGNLTAITDGLSGATFNEDTGTLFLIRNVSGGAGHSYEYTADGTLLRTITQTGFVDTEAIAWMYGTTFAIAEENDNQRISIVTIATGATTLDRTAPGNVTWTTPVGSLLNLGIESMCYDAGRDVLYYLTEKPSGGTWNIWRMNPQTGVSAVVCDLFASISTAGVATDLTDIALDRATDTLLLLSHESSKIIRVDFTGTVLEQRGFTTALAQAEALALTADRERMFAGGEPKQFARYALPATTLRYAVVTPPAHGTLTGVLPRLTYTPAPDFHGEDSFTFRMFDGTDYSPPATVSLTVSPVNDPPSGAPTTASVEATEPAPIALPVSEPDGDTLTIETTAPAHGTLTVAGTTATYTGEAGYTGPDAFTYTVSDGALTAGPFTVSLTVLPFNVAPVASAQSVTLDEDTPAGVTLAATDAETQPLTWTIVTPPAHGTLSGTAPELVFTPNANYHGADSFTFRVSDGQENSNTAAVSLTIAPVNDAPVAVPGSYSVEAGSPLALSLAASDADGDVLTLAIADPPAHGVLAGTPPNLTYTADIGFAGTDSLTFTASDGTLTSAPATVTVNVAAFNEPPVAASGSVITDEDTPAAITLSATDAESAPLTYTITSAPAHGTLSGTAPALTYTPAADYSGADSFTWTAHDGAKTSAPGMFSITINPVNDAPAATAQSISTRTDTAVPMTLGGTDPESDPLAFSIFTQPAHGTLSGTAPALTYTPEEGYAGPDSFTFLVNDGALDSAPATVSISVTAPALARGPYVQMTGPDRATIRWRTDVPARSVLHFGTAETSLTETVTHAVLKTSHELHVTGLSPDTRYYYSVGNPVLASGPTYYFTTHPPVDTKRPYRFWVLGDPGTGTATQTAVRDAFYTYNGATKVDGVLLLGDNAYDTGTDTEYQTKFFNIYPTRLRNTAFWPCFGNHDAGSANSGTQTGVYYSSFTMPRLAECGGVASGTKAYYSFDYGNIHFVCLDSEGSSRSGSGAMAQWLQADLSANWRDWTVAFWHHPPYSKGNHDSDNPAADSGKMKDMREIFVPILESFGVDLLLFGHEHAYFRSQFVDGHHGTSATFNAATMLKQAGFGDPAVDGPYLKASGAHTGAVFAIAGSSGKIDSATRNMPVLAVALNETGSVVLDVDGRQLTSRFLNSSGVVRDTFSILQNDPPTLAPAAFTGPEDAPLAFSLAATDPDGDTVTYELLTAPAMGMLSGTAPDFLYTPPANFHGSVTVEVRANDGRVNSANAIITLNITPENDPPTAQSAALSGSEDTAVALTLAGADLDGDAVTFTVMSPPAHGTLTGTAPDLVYTPDANSHGSDAFTFTTNDGSLTSAPAEVTLTISAVNDAPLATAVTLDTTEDTAVNVTLSGTDADGDTLSYVVTSLPAHGSLSGTLPAVTYLPDPDWHGTDSFSYIATDSTADSADAAVSITVTPVNDSPAALPQTLATLEDAPLPLTLSGTDTEGSPLTYAVTMPPAHGALSGTAPNLTYTPAADFAGGDEIQFTVSDGELTSEPATITIAVTPVNDAPLAVAASASTTEDTPTAIVLSGTDTEYDSLSFAITTPPAHGSLSGLPPNLTYTPALNYHGADMFSFAVADTEEISEPAVFSIEVSPVNDAPAAVAQSPAGPEDTALAITLTASDTEDDLLSYSVTVPPAHGTLSGTAPDLVYTPDANWHGSDVFTFTASDGTLTSAPAEVALTISAVNDAPMAAAVTVETTEDAAANFELSGTDVDGDELSYVVTLLPTHGSLSGSLPALTYTTDADFHGTDSFTYIATDGTADSVAAVVSITVSPVNDAPAAGPQTLATLEDAALPLTLSGTDTEGSSLTYAITEPPLHGVLSGTAPNLTYTPAADFSGSDEFKFTVNDGELTSEPATITLIVTPVNDAPIAIAASATTSEDTAVAVVLSGTDTEDDSLSFAITTPPPHGSLSGSPPNLIYTPAPDWNGTDSFGFTAADGTANSAEAIVSIEVTAVNDLPVAVAQTPTATEDTPLPLTLTASDVEGDALTFVITEPPQHGSLTGTAPDLTYTPNADFHGTDSFAFTAADATGPGLPATVSITVIAVNDAPLADAMTAETTEDAAVNLTLTGTDVDGDTLSFAVTSPPAHGTLSGTPPALTYLPDQDWHGTDSFAFITSDGSTDSEPAVVSITVTPVNDTPVALPQALPTAEDSTLPITLSATDVEGDTLSFTVTSPPQHGALTGPAPDLTYTPDANWYGSDSFSFTVSDGVLTSAPAVVTLSIAPANDAPQAAAVTVETTEDTAVIVTLSGTDVDGDTLSYVVTSLPAHGSLSGTLPALTYLPDPNRHGADSFSYIVSDGTVDSAPAVISITATPVNDPPDALSQALATAEDSALTVELTGADAEESSLDFAVTVAPVHGTLSGTVPNLTYTPAADFSGSDQFQFTVNDGGLTSVPAAITITVTPVNDAPLAVAAFFTTPEDTTVAVVLGGTDTESDALTFALTTPPAHGTLSGTAPDLTYTPDSDFNGTDAFEFTVTDGLAVSAPAAVTLTISPVNDAPIALAQAGAIEEDGALTLTLSGTDTENDALTFTVATLPVHGTLTGTLPDLTYTPAADFHGTDVFSFTVHDGDLTSAPAAVSITVQPVNDAPSATALSAETAEDTAVNLALTGTDIDGDALSAEIVTPPAHGTLSGENPNFTYTPDANWHGTDSFTFRTGDGLLFSEPAAVTITVLPVNDRPVALPQASSGVEDTALAVTLAATDIEGDTLFYTVTVPPAHGTLSGTAPDLTYLPSADWHGTDSFSFTASDAALTSPPEIVVLTIVPVNDAPSALPAAVQTNEDTALPITLTGTDIDGDALSYSIVTGPAHGTLSGTLPNAVYTPAADFHGTDEFIFTVNDGSAAGTPATVSIEVISVNDAPVAQSQVVSTAEDSVLIVPLGGTDTEGDPLTWSLTGQPAHGSASLDGNEVTYTPDENYNGSDAFVFQVSDGSASHTALVAITITTVNDAPVTSFDVFSVNEDQPLVVASARRILRNDSDFQEGAPLENNTPLTVVLETPPPHATSFSLAANGTFTYTPKPNFQGLDGFTYRAVDALGGISEAETVLIAVWAVNDAPVAAPQTLKTLEDVPLAIHLRSGDADNAAVFDPFSLPGIPPPNTGPAPHDADPIYTIVAPPQHGTLTSSGSTYAYTPAADFHGTDSFTFTASDGLATSDPATITITVEPDSDADLLPDAWENLAFATMAFTASDDPDGDGQDNTFEFIAGNNPADANSCLCLEAASPAPDGGVFRLNRVQPGVRYALQASTDLTAWDSISEVTYSLQGPGAIYDTRTTMTGRCFYRVTVSPE